LLLKRIQLGNALLIVCRVRVLIDVSQGFSLSQRLLRKRHQLLRNRGLRDGLLSRLRGRTAATTVSNI
jgi:hypothetical protein